MEAKRDRIIKDGSKYNHLFPAAEGGFLTVKRNAKLTDTVAFIPKAVKQTLFQTARFAEFIKGNDTYSTCQKLWYFVYEHIRYKKDANGYEQIRSPRRVWHDRGSGVDCDCYSVFISSVLTNLGIPHLLRITKYSADYFQHIYPVVRYGGSEIKMDCVTDEFNYEVPYSEKKDFNMDLQFLDGFDGNGLAELGELLERNMFDDNLSGKAKRSVKKVAKAKAAAPGGAAPKKKKGIFKKVLNVVNKVNPATVLLRNGVLAAMKLNVKNVAKRLRWSYLSADKIAQHGIDPERFQKLIATRQKLENIFYGAGGKPDNLRKAILGGKGNKDKAVNGLGMLPADEWTGSMNEYTALGHLLGTEIYYSENVEGMSGFQGFGELGEPVTLASVGAAMGVIAGIVAALKQVGDIFKKQGPNSADFDEAKTDAPENNVNIPATVTPSVVNFNTNSGDAPAAPDNSNEADNYTKSNPGIITPTRTPSPDNNKDEDMNTDEKSITTSTSASPASGNASNNNAGAADDKESFWEKNKKWIKPVAIGVGGLTLIAIGVKLIKSNKTPSRSSPKAHGLSGAPRKRKKKQSHRHKHTPKHAVALL